MAESGSTPRTGNAQRGPIPLSRVLEISAAFWLAAVLVNVIAQAKGPVLAATTLSAMVSTAFILLNPASTLVVLPFFTLLAPMTGLLELPGAKLLFTDILFIVLMLQFVVLVWRSGIRPAFLFNRNAYLVIGLYLFSMFFGLATGTLVSMKPLLYLVQLVIVGFYTVVYGSEPKSRCLILKAWLIATFFASMILLQAYSQGRNLDLMKTMGATPAEAPVNLLDLFRATYYYSGIHYILGLANVWLVTRLFFPLSRKNRLAVLIGLTLLVPALIATVNKTAIAAALLALLTTGVFLLYKFNRKMVSKLAWATGAGAVCAMVLAWQFNSMAEQSQLDLILGRLSSTSSLDARFSVYINAFGQWLSSPFRCLVGWGPDFLDSSGAPLIASTFKTAAGTGVVEGTVDSAWLSFLFELGIPALLMLFVFVARGLVLTGRNLFRAKAMNEEVYSDAALFGGILFLVVAMSTQMLGYSKLTWLPLQVLVLAASARRRQEISLP